MKNPHVPLEQGFTCPTCSAPVGVPCSEPHEGGNNVSEASFHQSRVDVANTVRVAEVRRLLGDWKLGLLVSNAVTETLCEVFDVD